MKLLKGESFPPLGQSYKLYLPQPLIVAFSGPHLRWQCRHKDTQGGKNKEKKNSRETRKEKKNKANKQKPADKRKY